MSHDMELSHTICESLRPAPRRSPPRPSPRPNSSGPRVSSGAARWLGSDFSDSELFVPTLWITRPAEAEEEDSENGGCLLACR